MRHGKFQRFNVSTLLAWPKASTAPSEPAPVVILALPVSARKCKEWHHMAPHATCGCSSCDTCAAKPADAFFNVVEGAVLLMCRPACSCMSCVVTFRLSWSTEGRLCYFLDLYEGRLIGDGELGSYRWDFGWGMASRQPPATSKPHSPSPKPS